MTTQAKNQNRDPKKQNPKKNQQEEETKNQEAENSASLETQENEVVAEVETHNVEDETGGISSILKRASASMTAPKKPKGKSRTTQYRKKKQEREQEAATTLVTILTLLLSSVAMPEEVKPNGEEINAFTVPVTNILLRHTNLTGKLSADALDGIGIIAVMSAYYARTSGDWKRIYQERQAKKETEQAAKIQEQNKEQNKVDPWQVHESKTIVDADHINRGIQ